MTDCVAAATRSLADSAAQDGNVIRRAAMAPAPFRRGQAVPRHPIQHRNLVRGVARPHLKGRTGADRATVKAEGLHIPILPDAGDSLSLDSIYFKFKTLGLKQARALPLTRRR